LVFQGESEKDVCEAETRRRQQHYIAIGAYCSGNALDSRVHVESNKKKGLTPNLTPSTDRLFGVRPDTPTIGSCTYISTYKHFLWAQYSKAASRNASPPCSLDHDWRMDGRTLKIPLWPTDRPTDRPACIDQMWWSRM